MNEKTGSYTPDECGQDQDVWLVKTFNKIIAAGILATGVVAILFVGAAVFVFSLLFGGK